MRARATRFSLLFLLLGCASNEPESRDRPRPPRPAPSVLEAPGAPLVDDTSFVAPAPTQDEPARGASAPNEKPPAPDGGQSAQNDAPPGVLGWIAGTPLSAEDLLVEWHSIAGRDVFLVLEKVVTQRLAQAEAQRLGLRLEPGGVELRVAEETRRLSQEIAKNEPELTVEEYIRTRIGVPPSTYFDRMRRATIWQMIAERAVRAWTLANDWARARMILVATLEEANGIIEELAAGADFAEIATERSLDDTAQDGGLIPFLVRQEGSPLAIAAFTVEIGEVAGPLAVADHQVLIRVEEKHAPLTGLWGAVSSGVEASLATNPIRDAEFLYWKLTMEQRYPIDLGRLKELLGIEG